MASKARIINVAVKQSHINKSIPGDDTACAVATSLSSRGYRSVRVYPYNDGEGAIEANSVRFTTKSGAKYLGKLPSVVARKLRKYDNGANIKPFSFNLAIEAA